MMSETKEPKTLSEQARAVRRALADAGLGRGFRKEYTLWPPRSEWTGEGKKESPTDLDVDRGCDMLNAYGDLMGVLKARRERGRGEVVEIYISARVGPIKWGEWELCDHIEVDLVSMEYTGTGRGWRPIPEES